MVNDTLIPTKSDSEGTHTIGSVTHILLVDDESSVLLALKLVLQAIGFQVRDFCVPQEALEFLAAGSQCDLCICDLRMPKMNGLAMLTETKKVRPSLPFVLMSAHAQKAEVDQAKALGAFGFLAKPFSPEQLKELVNSITHATTCEGIK